MALIDEIQMMRMAGKTDEEVMAAFKARGISPREISAALNQTAAPIPGAPAPEAEEMTPSLSAQPAQAAAPAAMPAEAYAAAPAAYPSEYGAGPAPEYGYAPQYGQTPEMSTDTLTEISEQVVTEKLSPLKKSLEQVLDLKTVLESKVEYIDERLKRIEKIIDKLQLSILQKVGDYATNIEDIKKEIVETQKSFKALVPALSSSPAKPTKPSASKFSPAA